MRNLGCWTKRMPDLSDRAPEERKTWMEANLEAERVFLLSPANVAGKRARMLLSPEATFELAQRLRMYDGVTLGEAFAFMSGLYFRGKLAHACAFARPPIDGKGVLVITSNRGLVSADAIVTPEELEAFSDVPIDARDQRYTEPLIRDSIATGWFICHRLLYCSAGEHCVGKICRPSAAHIWQKIAFSRGIRRSRRHESWRTSAAQRVGKTFVDSHFRGRRRTTGKSAA